MRKRDLSPIAITLGDPAGIGPEVSLKAAASLPSQLRRRIVLLGPYELYDGLARRMGLRLRPRDVSDVPDRRPDTTIPCLSAGPLSGPVRFGASRKDLTRAAVDSIRLGVRLAMERRVAALVTAPINKAGLTQAGYTMPGHTEYLAELSGTKRYEMMLVGGPLRVVLVTRHAALRDVPRLLTRGRVLETILMADSQLRRSFGIRRPRIAVCGLNPHAGESGRFGDEESRSILPAIRASRRAAKGVISGPHSPDALFVEAYAGRYDAVVCMYHDQGLIPLKMISRGAGVNVTLGLPFVRTSPDHGTAYDIAGKGMADGGSMAEAVLLAAKLSAVRGGLGR